jgi:hypothetical protein
MAKREIYAKEILNDIKAGMDDVSLIQKWIMPLAPQMLLWKLSGMR